MREGGRERGRGGREGGRGGEGREGREGGRECREVGEGGREGGREGREGERGEEGGRGWMTVIHILMAPPFLNNNHVTYYVITYVSVYAEQQWYVITSDVTWTSVR